jgi:hypothetical protein
MKNERWKRDRDYITVTTIYIHLFGCVCLKTGTGGRDSRDPTVSTTKPLDDFRHCDSHMVSLLHIGRKTSSGTKRGHEKPAVPPLVQSKIERGKAT